MAYRLKKKLYESLPDWLKAPVGWASFDILAGRPYRRTLERGRWIDRAGREELVAYQKNALATMLDFACDQVPAYRKFRGEVDRLPPFEALKAFPLLHKEVLQGSIGMYLPGDFDRIPHYRCTTGGTTGNQLTFYLDDDSQSVEMAFMHRQWARVGYTPRCRKATFRGVEFHNLGNGVYWQKNPIYNELQFSPYHMNDSTLPLYLKRLVKYRPSYLHGYPSAISLLADYLLRKGTDLSGLSLRAVLLGSEAVYSDQRALIERAFSTRVFSWYGHSERIVLGGECEETTAYHHFPDYGVLEIVDERGNAAKEGGYGELVGTGLLNRSLPLIRYRTGDRARRLPSRCKCGRCFDRFDEVEGRWKQEYVIGRNDSRISLAALNIHGPVFDRVRRYQYYQNTPGVMELRVMAAEGFGEEDIKRLSVAIARKLGDELTVNVKVVADIPLTKRGKCRRLIQEIPEQS